jgi:glutamate racemase
MILNMSRGLSKTPGPIGVFDSGFGGLTVLQKIRALLPKYDYLFLGDNARAPYGTRSFDVVYRYTLQGVMALFERGCSLVILACNTASAKALRTIQQNDLPLLDKHRRVLGVIRPTAEVVGRLTNSRHIGLLATPGTVSSKSYELEVKKLFPDISVTGLACPMWVPLVENFEYDGEGADYFVKSKVTEILQKDSQIDLLILGCTHFPFLLPKIRKYTPENVQIISQGEYVAASLQDYLHRHPEMNRRCSKKGKCNFLTTEESGNFDGTARLFLQEEVKSEHIDLED